MKWFAIILGCIAALVLLVVVIGVMLPQSHVAIRSARLHQPAGEVWKTITDVGSAGSWRNDVVRIEMLPPRDGRIVWREVSKDGAMNYEGEAVRSPAPGMPGRFISRITDRTLPFGGEWITDVSIVDGGTVVKITENGEVYNPLFRFVSKYVLGHASTIDGYLRALGQRYGESVTPVDG